MRSFTHSGNSDSLCRSFYSTVTNLCPVKWAWLMHISRWFTMRLKCTLLG